MTSLIHSLTLFFSYFLASANIIREKSNERLSLDGTPHTRPGFVWLWSCTVGNTLNCAFCGVRTTFKGYLGES